MGAFSRHRSACVERHPHRIRLHATGRHPLFDERQHDYARRIRRRWRRTGVNGVRVVPPPRLRSWVQSARNALRFIRPNRRADNASARRGHSSSRRRSRRRCRGMDLAGKIPLGHAPWPSTARSRNSRNLKRPVYRSRTCLGGLEAMAIIPVALPLQRSRAVHSPPAAFDHEFDELGWLAGAFDV
jgi:hypothetical protein